MRKKKQSQSELKTLEWDSLNIMIGNLIWRLITRGEQTLFKLEIKKKRSIDLILISTILKFSELKTLEWDILNPDYLKKTIFKVEDLKGQTGYVR